ncbi:MtnX-like HAD-IB family phosphatase [Agrobacterium fabrum]|uniref:MtnX-like HAD-IB family phosphatase n=1 Tax=Agrobacterium fabrum TaxID=1176649 RepID=UPI0015716E17|nr:MtnX-like HAD-IB family phosphatase [Agrobacterium fabrum]WCK79840.1 MtnX-like HAD-IB family phosphatase [Agrobacterium fabrum]
MRVFCDFDGTISRGDTTDQVLTRFADPEWEEIEQLWLRGLIGSAECMRRQITLLDVAPDDLDAFLDTVTIDPGFLVFLASCKSWGVPVTVVSDGVGYFIRRILARHGIEHLPIVANILSRQPAPEGMVYSINQPLGDGSCSTGSGVCKCAVIEGGDRTIYIGDGRSDFCVSEKADVVFAKDALADHCNRQAIPFIKFDTFTDLLPRITSILSNETRFHRAQPQSRTA